MSPDPLSVKLEGRYGGVPVSRLKEHPDAGKMPAPDSSTFGSIRESIRRDGIRVPLDVTPDDVILAGTTRFRIAKELGIKAVPVRMVDIPEDRQFEYILRDNLERRQLTLDQRAQVVALLIEHGFGRKPKPKVGTKATARPVPPEVRKVSREEQAKIAKQAKVSKETVARVAKVAREDPKAFEKITKGEKTLREAEAKPVKSDVHEVPVEVDKHVENELVYRSLPGKYALPFDQLDRLAKVKSKDSKTVAAFELHKSAILAKIDEHSNRLKEFRAKVVAFKPSWGRK